MTDNSRQTICGTCLSYMLYACFRKWHEEERSSPFGALVSKSARCCRDFDHSSDVCQSLIQGSGEETPFTSITSQRSRFAPNYGIAHALNLSRLIRVLKKRSTFYASENTMRSELVFRALTHIQIVFYLLSLPRGQVANCTGHLLAYKRR
jgi:hypothetical protein